MTALADVIITKRLRWVGHVCRMPDERLPGYLLNWAPKHGKRSRGRPRKSLNDSYIEDAEQRIDKRGLTIDRIKEMAADRKSWRTLTRRSCIVDKNDTVDAD